MFLSPRLLENVLQAGLSHGADFCEVYMDSTDSYTMELKDSKTQLISGRDYGIGLRLFYKNEEFYAYTNKTDEQSLIKLITQLAELKKQPSSPKTIFSLKESELKHQWNIDLQKRKKQLEFIDKQARSLSSLISQCGASFKINYKQVQIANSEGLLLSDFRPYTHLSTFCVAEKEGVKEQGFSTIALSSIEDDFSDEDLIKKSQESGKLALKNLDAEPAPSGRLPVIINNGFGGVIFHEACGHGLETTSVADNISCFSDKLNQKIAKPIVNAVDDGTIKNTYGFLNIDDEGRPAEKTVLIKDGVLKNFMADKLGALKTNYKMTGSARRENYRYPPTSRMRNTFIQAGKSSLEEMVSDVEHGLFAETMGGGSVTPGTGNYNFAVTSARLIKNGKLDKRVKGASLIGNGLETLSSIVKVGSDVKLAPGHCGSVSGFVPVTVGGPPLLVSELTVGGPSSKTNIKT